MCVCVVCCGEERNMICQRNCCCWSCFLVRFHLTTFNKNIQTTASHELDGLVGKFHDLSLVVQMKTKVKIQRVFVLFCCVVWHLCEVCNSGNVFAHFCGLEFGVFHFTHKTSKSKSLNLGVKSSVIKLVFRASPKKQQRNKTFDKCKTKMWFWC